MKIAVASDNEIVASHFGHCEGFSIFEASDKQIVKSEYIPNPGHRPGFLPNFLNDLGVNIIISGGMGRSAIELFKANDIEVITGAEGNVRAVAEQYLQGNLKSTGSVCQEHMHHGNCGGH